MLVEKIKKGLNHQLPPLVWSFFIFLGSSLPAAQVSQNSVVNLLAHKFVHLLEYSLLYLFYYRSLVENFWQVKKGLIFKALLYIILFGVLDEYHQSFVPGRQSRALDVLTDLLGGLIGLSLWWFFLQKQAKRQKI